MNKFAMSRPIIRHAALLVLASVLVGCGGSKTVITADDSAEYRNAIALPPLKKPARPAVSSSQVDSATESSAPSSQPLVVEPESVDELQDNSDQAITATQEPAAQDQEPSAQDQEPLAQDQELPAPEAAPISATTKARVIELGGDIARLQIDADLDSAWSFLKESLKRSDITVHSRNKTAGRFAIGCASLQAESTAPAKKGGWSFFTKKAGPTEHCSLLLASGRSATQVKLLNRSGGEYTADDSKALFARLLNN